TVVYFILFFFLCILFLFFFQAEDGIRDKLVTGVQTCALPICPLRADPMPLHVVGEPLGPNPLAVGQVAAPHERGRRPAQPEGRRSEERRVGKECRSRWSPEN